MVRYTREIKYLEQPEGEILNCSGGGWVRDGSAKCLSHAASRRPGLSKSGRPALSCAITGARVRLFRGRAGAGNYSLAHRNKCLSQTRRISLTGPATDHRSLPIWNFAPHHFDVTVNALSRGKVRETKGDEMSDTWWCVQFGRQYGQVSLSEWLAFVVLFHYPPSTGRV
jgi:hypothetical protein